MKKVIIVLICLFISPAVLYCWSSASHKGMTRVAAKEIFKLDTVSVKNLSVKVDYNMFIDFFRTILKGTGGMEGMLLSSVGLIIDASISENQYNIDTTMTYKNTTEIKMIAEAGQNPDKFDDKTAVFGDGKCLVGHMYAPNGLGFADYMTEYFYKEADTAYTDGKTQLAYAYLGYASHYLVDVAVAVHAEADFLNQKNLQLQWDLHSTIEDWIANNWNKYFDKTAIEAAKYPMPVCNIPATVRSLGLETYPHLAEWYQAWGISSRKSPKNLKKFNKLVEEAIWRCVPKVSGLFLKFKQNVMGK